MKATALKQTTDQSEGSILSFFFFFNYSFWPTVIKNTNSPSPPPPHSYNNFQKYFLPSCSSGLNSQSPGKKLKVLLPCVLQRGRKSGSSHFPAYHCLLFQPQTRERTGALLRNELPCITNYITEQLKHRCLLSYLEMGNKIGPCRLPWWAQWIGVHACQCGDTGSIPSPGRVHMLWNNEAFAPTTEPVL